MFLLLLCAKPISFPPTPKASNLSFYLRDLENLTRFHSLLFNFTFFFFFFWV
uniref:Uncharacterized protein n=1 Tax=Nelumbo nucifera TaxID=4432 RepID=A0A822XTF9_NELNU|nr:TPA_asm: hypothetical protein HUJ06_025142 [Nelumbo nucifera]